MVAATPHGDLFLQRTPEASHPSRGPLDRISFPCPSRKPCTPAPGRLLFLNLTSSSPKSRGAMFGVQARLNARAMHAPPSSENPPPRVTSPLEAEPRWLENDRAGQPGDEQHPDPGLCHRGGLTPTWKRPAPQTEEGGKWRNFLGFAPPYVPCNTTPHGRARGPTRVLSNFLGPTRASSRS